MSCEYIYKFCLPLALGLIVIYKLVLDRLYINESAISKHQFKFLARPSHRPKPVNDSIILTTNVRSGSSFVGELLKNDPDSFYAYEPLMFITRKFDDFNGKTQECKNNTVRALVDLMVNCKIERLKKCKGISINWTKSAFGLKGATFDGVHEKCVAKKHRATKVNRAHDLQELVSAFEQENTFIVYLVRDPRGIMTSRNKIWGNKTMTEFNKKMKNQAKLLCGHFDKNLEFLENEFRKSKSVIQDWVVVIRYEDFAYNPQGMAQKLYSFLGREIPENVEEFIIESTNGKGRQGRFNTNRNSTATAEAWKQRITKKQLEFIQKTCSNMMARMGYKLVYDHSVLLNKTYSLVSKINAKLPTLQ